MSLLTLQMLSHVVRQSDTALQVLIVAKYLGDVAAHREEIPAGTCHVSLKAVRLSWHLLNSNRAKKFARLSGTALQV